VDGEWRCDNYDFGRFGAKFGAEGDTVKSFRATAQRREAELNGTTAITLTVRLFLCGLALLLLKMILSSVVNHRTEACLFIPQSSVRNNVAYEEHLKFNSKKRNDLKSTENCHNWIRM
jgi:hypothetical protein